MDERMRENLGVMEGIFGPGAQPFWVFHVEQGRKGLWRVEIWTLKTGNTTFGKALQAGRFRALSVW